MSILQSIVAHKEQEIAARKRETSLEALLHQLPSAPVPRDFRAALVSSDRPPPRVIAEIKRRSPSRGSLRPGLDPASLARVYQHNGASAISVLTDGHYFGGSFEDLSKVHASVDVPVLCKEFIIDPFQVYEARLAGADAILLIADILSFVDLRELRLLAESLGMAALVEVHGSAQLGVALAAGAELIGINNRDLHTFEVNLAHSRELRPLIPYGKVTVSESGISKPADRVELHSMGVDALLVGESLLTASDVAHATRLMCGLTASIREVSLV